MIWLIFLGTMFLYSLGVAFTQKLAIKQWYKERELKFPQTLRTPTDYAAYLDRARTDTLFLAFLWPVMWVVLLWESVSRGSIETDRLKALRAEQELERVKQLARQHGMSFPDDHSFSGLGN